LHYNSFILKKLGLILIVLLGSLSGYSQCTGTPPDPIVIDSVSVDPFGNVVVSWQASNSTNIAVPVNATPASYTIRRVDPITGNPEIIPSAANISVCAKILLLPLQAQAFLRKQILKLINMQYLLLIHAVRDLVVLLFLMLFTTPCY